MIDRPSHRPTAPRLLLALGLLAVALHLWAAVALPAGAAGSDGFVAEVCTSHGLAAVPGGGTPAPAGHDCCKLCGAGAPLLLAAPTAAVPPAPTLAARTLSTDTAVLPPVARSAHAPRGPPRA